MNPLEFRWQRNVFQTLAPPLYNLKVLYLMLKTRIFEFELDDIFLRPIFKYMYIQYKNKVFLLINKDF